MRVLRRTTDEVVALKPAGLATEVSHDPTADSVLTRLTRSGLEGLHLVHRLDAPASGLLLLARARAAAAWYSAEIEARRWHKWYVARIAGSVPAASLVGPHKAFLKTSGRRAEIVRAGGKASFLDVVAVTPTTDASGDHHALVRLHTGRFHQIRAMLADAGAPLRGDATYGGPPGAFYLEHVVLGARTFGDQVWTVWQAPAHDDRDPWTPVLAAAVDALAATARTAPPLPDRDR